MSTDTIIEQLPGGISREGWNDVASSIAKNRILGDPAASFAGHAEGWKDIHREMLARPSLNGNRHRISGDGGSEI